ncbi:TAXI family TRAP transporter solute-binding subunit [Pseudooceanicola pacificus]|nr:TAXI family TRAP transporter solute-binding subunit [Pseudooceanicola pacificus]
MKFTKLAVFAAAMTALPPMTASAQELEFPATMVWSAYPTGAMGYAHAVAFGNVLQTKYGSSLRVLPGQNDVARLLPLKAGRADLCICGIGAYSAVEGLGDFASRDWGPQPYRVLRAGYGDYGFAPLSSAKSGIKDAADIAGKRVVYIPGSDSQNEITTAYLAFAGLTWDDVERVEIPGYTQGVEAIGSGQADLMAAGSVATPTIMQLQTSPRGIYYVPLPAEDTEGWARLQAVAPYLSAHQITVGATMSADNPHAGAIYPYPILIVKPDYAPGLAHDVTSFMADDYDAYAEAAPAPAGWKLDRQRFDGVFPFHEGAVAYFKEQGMWTDEAQAHQDMLLKRQEVLAQAWTDYTASAPDDDEAFKAGWLKARQAALDAAKL